MTAFARNHLHQFRPLRGGVAIMNGINGPSGTLGCIATSGGADRWIVSAHHVLRGARTQLIDNESIFQPALGSSDTPVATTVATRGDFALDIAAALVLPGVSAINEILGIGSLGPVAEPLVDMRVLKSGIATGVTEGIVVDVSGDLVRIEMLAGYPSKYELSEVSDSGSVWLEEATASPVALHVAGNDTGIEVAVAVRMSRVLQVLDLRLA